MRCPGILLAFFIVASIDAAAGQQPVQSGVVVGHDAINSTIINNPSYHFSLTPDQVRAIQLADPERSEEQRRLITLLEEKVQLREDQIKVALRIFQKVDIPADQYGEKLLEFAKNYTQIKSELDRISRQYPSLKSLRVQAQEAIDGGNLEGARELIKKAQEEAMASKPQAAELVALDALTATLQFDYEQAASLYQAAAILSSADPTASLRYSLEYARQLIQNANEKHFRDYDRAIKELDRIRAYPGFDNFPFANTVNLELGVSIEASAIASANKTELERAKQILSGVLKTLEPGSHDWAEAMQSLASCNLYLGNPTEAVSIYEKLFANPSGTKYATDPRTLVNFGAAYGQLAENSGDLEIKQKSFGYFQKAYENIGGWDENTKGQVTFNFAISVFEKGTETNDIEFLRKSVQLFNETLNYLNQSKEPRSWADTETDLGIAHLAIGRITGELSEFRQCIEAQNAALLVWEPDEPQDRYLDSMFLIVDSYQELAVREDKPVDLESIIKTTTEVLKHIDHDYQSEQLMKAYLNMADANFYLLKRYHDQSRLSVSKLYYEKAARLLGERVMSNLLTKQEAYPQAVKIKSKLDQLTVSTTPKD